MVVNHWIAEILAYVCLIWYVVDHVDLSEGDKKNI